VWRQTTGTNHHFIAYAEGTSGGGWYVQQRDALGMADGVLVANNASPSPDLVPSGAWWRVGGDFSLPSLRCVEATRLPTASDVTLRGNALYLDTFTDVSGHAAFARLGRGLRARGIDDPKLCLFRNVSPTDLNQGTLGNCWMVAGLAAVASVPGAIQALCTQKTLSPVGRYDVALFHPTDHKWTTVTVDDRLPVFDAEKEPIQLSYMKATEEGEIWPVIFEKAVAKLFGSYPMLEGNSAMVILSMLTGCTGDSLLVLFRDKGSGEWRCGCVSSRLRRLRPFAAPLRGQRPTSSALPPFARLAGRARPCGWPRETMWLPA
jgi:hypothetical protein